MPFIKKIKIYGFKSFAYKTEIEFKDGIAGIVGPNGCGKSNVIESLMWVFGERGSKSMRTENMADIIFAGTEEHKPLGLAEVEVIIDNGNMLLPVEYREVSIKRRVFRSNESEFFINRQKCRLKDIQELFADTGIGKGAYSFMEQGKIDMILSNKPEERRIIFEEAAGISKYKLRRKESMQKLERTENNLSQVNMFLRELKQEREKLKIQAEKSLVYSRLQEELKKYEIEFYGYKYKLSIKTKNEIDKKIKTMEDKERELIAKTSHHDVLLEKLEKDHSGHKQMKFEKEKDQSRIEQIIKGDEDKIKIYSGQIEKNNALIQNKRQVTETISGENEKLKKHVRDLESKAGILVKKMTGEEEKKKLLALDIDKVSKKIKENLKLKEELTQKIRDEKKALHLDRETLKQVTESFVKEIDRKKQEVEHREDDQGRIKKELNDIVARIEDGIESITGGDKKVTTQQIKESIKALKKIVKEISLHQDEFKNMIFDKEGIYAKKESLDKKIADLTNSIMKNQSRVDDLESENHRLIQDEKMLDKKLYQVEKDLNQMQFHYEQVQNEMDKVKADMERNNKDLENINKEIKNFSSGNAQDVKTIDKMKAEIIKLTDRMDEINKTITKIDQSINSCEQQIIKVKQRKVDVLQKKEDMEQKLRELRDDFSRTQANVEDFNETLYNEYNIKIKDVIGTLKDSINLKDVRNNIEKVRMEIKNLGSVNLLAAEEYEDVDKRYNFNLKQKEDLMKSKNDLLQIITETNKECTRIFLETFSKINENFHYIFRRLFGGGRANIELEEESSPLESGIIINVQPPGKKLKSISWLSGGERSLSAIGLMFSIFLVKPSPFGALDEIDAALDEENNRRFIKMMKEFAKNSQFLIISHNANTISHVDYLYGVSMEEKGVSKVVSLELRKEKIKEYIKKS
ncbi:MAG: AAA family ATPase [Spirochaetes bacterium]|nr:AAA family ATPase [Spirochaetota bacterium]